MSCGCSGNKRQRELVSMRELAKKAATMDGCVYILYLKPDGFYGIAKENETYEGKLIEYVYGK